MKTKNYRTINTTASADNMEWGLSAKVLGTLQQIELQLNDGKSYKYLTRFAAKEGDVAVVGNSFIQNYELSEPMATTGQMGIATEVLDKAVIKKNHAGEMDFVFTSQMDKKQVQNCVKYLYMPTDMKNYCYNKYIAKCYPITYLIRKVLAAATVLSFDKYSKDDEKAFARDFIISNHAFEDDLFYNVDTGAPFGCALSLVDTHIDLGDKPADYLDSLNVGLEGGCLEYDGELSSDSRLDEYVNKYVNIGAVSIMVRGGFCNLLKAYLSTGINIDAYKHELIEGLSGCGNKNALTLLESTPVILELSQSAKTTNDLSISKDFRVLDGKLLGYSGNETNVVIPDGIKSIENGAFKSNNALTCVTIPKTVKKIGKDAFSGCKKLNTVVFSEGLTTIGNGAFSYCQNLEELCLPESISKIGKSAFYLCKKISKVTLGSKVKSVGECAFSICPLEEVHIKGDDTEFDAYPFGDKPWIKIYVYSDTISLSQIGVYRDSTYHCHKGSQIEHDLIQINEQFKSFKQIKIEHF